MHLEVLESGLATNATQYEALQLRVSGAEMMEDSSGLFLSQFAARAMLC